MEQKGFIKGVKKIAVLRAIGLGDFLISLPALEALRNTYNSAEISLLARPWNVQFAKGRKLPFDRIISIPETYGINDPPGFTENSTEIQAFVEKMQQEQFDIAIQLHGGGNNSNPFTKKLGAQITVGAKTPDAMPLDRWTPYIFFQHEVHRTLEIMSLIGAKPITLVPRLPVTEEDTEGAKTTIDITKPYIVLHPGASDPKRHWGAHNFARVGDTLARQGYQIVITGTGDEQRIVNEVLQLMREQATDVCNKLSFNGLIGVLSHAQLLISNDTGPLHLAQAVQTPTVGIFWFPNLVNWGPLSRTWNRTACSYIDSCPVCGVSFMKDEYTISQKQKPCNHLSSLVDTVTTEEVLMYAVELLELKKQNEH